MTNTNNKITLQVDGLAPTSDSIMDWNADVYQLDGAARGTGQELDPIALDLDAVLDLELADGTRILVAAEDAERYLGPAVGRGADQTATIRIGHTLRLSGPRLPSVASREGIGAWILKALRVYKKGPSGMTALFAAGSFQDWQLGHRNGLYHCSTDGWELAEVDQLAGATKPTLIFLHGTASSTEGSFKGLWEDSRYLKRLIKIYGTRIYAFEHRSLTESPVANVLDLVKTLPHGACLHLVSHSRGGMVGELLARANRIDQNPFNPFTESEIDRFLIQAKRVGRSGFKDDARRLRELNHEMRSRNIRVERFVRVACPAQGTTLASGRLDRWASVMLNLLGKGIKLGGKVLAPQIPIGKGYDLLQNFLLAVVKERTDAHILPGLEAMMPDSPLVALLNGPDVIVEPPLHILAGDYQGDGLLSWMGDCLAEVFYGGETDLVVNTPSMNGGAGRSKGIHQKPLFGPEVHHLSYFRRNESADALLGALEGSDEHYVRLSGPSDTYISRGGRKTKVKDDAPIVFLLPGIMGSHIQIGRNRIWFEPFSMCTGEMKELKVDAKNVSADGWMDRSYEKLADFLAESHEVRPFAYDWRLSITDAARKFGIQLDRAMKDARVRRKSVRIVAHSMGGLVARLALKTRWDKFKKMPGNRLLQLGTPNNGSHSIAAVLMGRDDFVQMIERWFDWKHDMCEFLEIVREFPGVLELLPWQEESGVANDGVDYFNEKVWQDWYGKDQDPRKVKSWMVPSRESLDAARDTIKELLKANIDPECSLYVAGHAPTPVAVRVENGQVEIGMSNEGDGRVAWETGIPPGVPVYYTEAAHGDLASNKKVFEAYRQLIESGDTQLLSRTPAVRRGSSSLIFQPRSLTSHALYPRDEEVQAAAMGGVRPGYQLTDVAEPPTKVEVIHGSLASAESPVLIGAYAHDSLRGSAEFLDGHLGGRMDRAYLLGRYPQQAHEAMVFHHPDEDGKPAGAIVVGLGPVGDLLPGTLTEALVSGMLEYARIKEQQTSDNMLVVEYLDVSSLLVGAGFTGLTIEASSRCLVDAARRTNLALGQVGMKTRIGKLSIFEEVENRAVLATQMMCDLRGEELFRGVISFSGRLIDGQGGYCGRCYASGGQPGMSRVHINAKDGALHFTVMTDRARNVVSAEPDQRQAVDGLINSVTDTTKSQPGLSRALFELLVPNSMKETVADLRTLMLSVDPEAATYPWELMRDDEQINELPLVARVELIRQLASTHGRERVRNVRNRRVFVVGDTQSGHIELPGAQAEAKSVAGCFIDTNYEVKLLIRANAQEVFDALFNGHYRYMHLAGHGVVKDEKTGSTGMVLGPLTYLTSAQVTKLPRVPEFVFINCCHLGAMGEDSQPRWGQLAANMATEFIEMGCKAVIAAGWAVDDGAAETFARTFYKAMLKGVRFGKAVREARRQTYRSHPTTNTWGAYQAYGDERYRFTDFAGDGENEISYVHPSHIIADLDMLGARLMDATQSEKKEYYTGQIKAVEAAIRGTDFQHAGVREKLATAWAELDDKERAIGHYRAALGLEDATFSLRAIEQLANLEIRYGAELIKQDKSYDEGKVYMEDGLKRLTALLDIGETVERRCLLGSYYKRRAQVSAARRNRKDIKQCLADMQREYWQAAKLSYRRTGGWDYYPLLNALDAVLLSSVWGTDSPPGFKNYKLADLLYSAAKNGRRRFAEKRNFFHAMAEVEVERIDALWACFDQRTEACISDAEVLKKLVRSYCDLLKRLGSAREQDSTINQLDFLIAMLPSDDKSKQVKGALHKLSEGIKEGLVV